MNTADPNHLLAFLEGIQAKPIETYTHFPEIIRSGSKQLEKEEFDYLYAEGYIVETASDKFGKQFTLSERARRLLRNTE